MEGELIMTVKSNNFSQEMIDFVNSSSEKKKEWMEFYYSNSLITSMSIGMAKQAGLNEVETLQLCVHALETMASLERMKELKEI